MSTTLSGRGLKNLRSKEKRAYLSTNDNSTETQQIYNNMTRRYTFCEGTGVVTFENDINAVHRDLSDFGVFQPMFIPEPTTRACEYKGNKFFFLNGDIIKLVKYYDSFEHKTFYYPKFRNEHKFLWVFKRYTWHILPGFHRNEPEMTPSRVPFISSHCYLRFKNKSDAKAWIFKPNHTVNNILSGDVPFTEYPINIS
jgi:hypothetical protein